MDISFDNLDKVSWHIRVIKSWDVQIGIIIHPKLQLVFPEHISLTYKSLVLFPTKVIILPTREFYEKIVRWTVLLVSFYT